MAMDIAEKVITVTEELGIPYVFKGSYRKANRSRLDSFTGIGDEKALGILRKVRETFGVPVVTDIHTPEEAVMAAEYVDILQIPAFLCRQTDLLVAAARTGRTVNIKKGQFLSPEAMSHAVTKVIEAGNNDVAITERGTSFGYQDLIVDYRGIPVMKGNDCPVILDATHSLQQPNQTAGVTGRRPELIETIARCGIAAGVDGLFMETHQDRRWLKATGQTCCRLTVCPICSAGSPCFVKRSIRLRACKIVVSLSHTCNKDKKQLIIFNQVNETTITPDRRYVGGRVFNLVGRRCRSGRFALGTRDAACHDESL